MSRTGILAFHGDLPAALVAARPDMVVVTFDGVGAEPPAGDGPLITARFEQLGALWDALRAEGVDELVFAGAVSRPAIDPTKLDAGTMRAMQVIGPAFTQGDDALLRAVIAAFEAEGFTMRAAHEVAPELVLPAGTVWGHEPGQQEEADAARGAEILAALSPLDVSQAAVVEAGLCLGIETLQGTDALLACVAQTPDKLRRGKGVLVKTAKTGQDLRADMPTIGPATIEGVRKAGLGGLVIGAGAVIVLNQPKVREAVEEHGLFLAAR